MKKRIFVFLTMMLIILCVCFFIQVAEKEKHKEELLSYYNQICMEIEQEEDSDAIIGYLPEIVNKLMPVLKDEDYIKVLKNDEYCYYFKFLMMDLYADQHTEPKTEQYEKVLLEIVKDKSQPDMLRVDAAGHLDKERPEYVEDILALYDEVESDGHKMRLLKVVCYMDEKAANKLAQEILDDTSARASEDEDLLEFARKTVMRTKD